MSQTIEEIRSVLTLMFNKLETIDFKLKKQEEDIKAYMKQCSANLNSNELIIAGLRSTRTYFELLRDEIDELHQLTVALFNEG